MDRDLVRRAQQGDSRALEAVLRCVSPRLFRLAARLTGHRQAAEDLVEETLYRGALKLGQVREPDAVYAWFRRVCLNRWRDRLRAPERRLFALEDVPDPVAPPADEPAARYQTAELRERIAAAVASMPPGQRAVLTLQLEDGLTVGEIARELGTTPDRVKANLWHARRRLREALGDDVPERRENST